MDFDGQDVEKDFPGLYSSEGADAKSKKSKDSSDFSEGEHEKVSKTDLLIGKRKDKKDRGYAALAGESSPEESATKSLTKSKKSKAFKFTSSRSKEKREKSRDKSEYEDKVKEKEKPDKDKKKDKKEKRDKKSKQSSTTSEEVLELGDMQPVFGVSINLAVERCRCHDGIDLPLVVRDCIDYLQEHALQSEQIYRIEPDKVRLHYFKRLYNNRERQPDTDVLDMPLACGLLKLFLCELSEPILTSELMSRFEEVASYAQVTKQEEELKCLIEKLPKYNKTLLSWIILHFDAVIQNEKSNKINAQSLAVLLSPAMQISQRLLVTLLCYCPNIFAQVKLIKYIPPITATSPQLPETVEDIEIELLKQESLLSQLHAEMNAGFVSKKREEQLWEVQRIITQLKRTLRAVKNQQDEKKLMKSINIVPEKVQISTELSVNEKDVQQPEEPQKMKSKEITPTDKDTMDSGQNINENERNSILTVPGTQAEYEEFVRLQLENNELKTWKAELQQRISRERAELLHLKQTYQYRTSHSINPTTTASNTNNCRPTELHIVNDVDDDYEHIIESLLRENTLLEYKKNMLSKQIFDERCECIRLQVELQLRQK